jgi:EAL domain-containing protein (putative c-di-GMP-specific phosphodiesterase class I)
MTSLPLALERNELEVHYQPQVRIADNRISGLEALVRWRHPTRGLVPPALFIPAAEETGDIVAIGRWVLETACRQATEWNAAGFAPLRIAVNVSPRQLLDSAFASDVSRILTETELPPGLLELEVTESVVMAVGADIVGVLGSLRELGVLIAIDDFGTGQSSLRRLRNLHVDTLKIDGSFVGDVCSDVGNRVIAETIFQLTRALGLRVIAEGVETMCQLHYLRHAGCDEAQGFLFSRPIQAHEVEQTLRAGLEPVSATEEPLACSLVSSRQSH